jgi:hypothetical protein
MGGTAQGGSESQGQTEAQGHQCEDAAQVGADGMEDEDMSKRKPIGDVLAKLRELIGDTYDGVDVQRYCDALRGRTEECPYGILDEAKARRERIAADIASVEVGGPCTHAACCGDDDGTIECVACGETLARREEDT